MDIITPPMQESFPEPMGTPEYEYAGFWRRFWASMIDSILIIAITFPLLYMIYGAEYFESEDIIMGGWDIVISYLFPIVATIVFWTQKSATPGKMLLKLAIIDEKTGGMISAKQAVGRYFAYILSTLPLCLGFLWVAFDKRKQGWHDKLAGTLVVRR